LKLDASPVTQKQLQTRLTKSEDESGNISHDRLIEALTSLGIDSKVAEKYAHDYFGFADPHKFGSVPTKSFVWEWTRMQLFKSLRYLWFLQQKAKKQADDQIDAAKIKEVLTAYIGEEASSEQWTDLLKRIDGDGDAPDRGVSAREIALWYYGNVKHYRPMSTARRTALLIIDVQYDFLPPDGSLAVTDGLAVIPVINDLRKKVKWDVVAMTQDWHPKSHVSFHVNNKHRPEAELFAPLQLENGSSQVMWPAHCVQGSHGATFHKDLIAEDTDKIVQKGTSVEVDSYSGFFDNDHKRQTELAKILKAENITDVWVVGLAYDYCVGYSALDAYNEGFRVAVVEDATRGVAPDSTKAMKAKLLSSGIAVVQSSEVPRSGLVS